MSAASRPTVVYVVMLIACAVGLWIILSVGENLKPPANLAGQWELTATTPQSAKVGTTLQVDQSGRFFQVAFDSNAKIGMKLTDGTPSHIALSGDNTTLEFIGLDKPDAAQLVMNTTAERHTETWTIHRIKQAAPAVRGAH